MSRCIEQQLLISSQSHFCFFTVLGNSHLSVWPSGLQNKNLPAISQVISVELGFSVFAIVKLFILQLRSWLEHFCLFWSYIDLVFAVFRSTFIILWGPSSSSSAPSLPLWRALEFQRWWLRRYSSFSVSVTDFCHWPCWMSRSLSAGFLAAGPEAAHCKMIFIVFVACFWMKLNHRHCSSNNQICWFASCLNQQ